MSNDDMARSVAAHAAYLAETRQLVDAHTDALFGLLTTVLARARSYEPAVRHAEVSRHDHTLAVTNGACTEVFTVEAISDLPDGADRAYLFPTSQARCTVQAPDGSAVEWLLKRDATGDRASAYAWMLADSTTRIGEPEINGVLRPLVAC